MGASVVAAAAGSVVGAPGDFGWEDVFTLIHSLLTSRRIFSSVLLVAVLDRTVSLRLARLARKQRLKLHLALDLRSSIYKSV